MFASVIPGLAPILRQVLSEVPGVTVHDSGFDGRSDLILFDVDKAARADVMELGMTEDVFVEVGRTLRADGDKPGWIAGRIWRPARVERALSVWGQVVKPLKTTMTFRVIVRVLQERSFKRTELRRHLTEAVQRDRPKWRITDPAELEVWVSEYAQGRFIAGLRLSSIRMRQRDGRAVERPGALRPTVANALVNLAGQPNGLLLDPCCGSGTILDEALAAGWDVMGIDIDPDAVDISRQNVPQADVRTGDVRSLEIGDASIDVCVSNLPFGQQYSVQGSRTEWLSTALAEIARVTKSGGRVVILVPEIPRSLVPTELQLRLRFPIRLLGTKTTIWVYDRT
jgi:tRNA G10  N-methylase Trm11